MAENTNKRLTRYGRDGANYTSRATFDCFYDPENHDHVIIDYQVYIYVWAYYDIGDHSDTVELIIIDPCG